LGAHVRGAFVVNIDDCLMRWSSDINCCDPALRISTHTPTLVDCIFLAPNPDSVISALPGTGAAKYAQVTGAGYLCSRLDAI